MRKDDTDSYGADRLAQDDDPTFPDGTGGDPNAAAGPNPIPTNPDGSQVGGGTSWDPGSQAPSSAPSGYHWDADMAMFQPDAPVATPTPQTTTPATTTASASTPAPAAVAPLAVPASASSSAPAVAATPAAQAAVTPPTVAPATNPNQPFNDAIRQALLDAIGRSSKDVSANDPEVAPAILANKVTNERSLEQERNDIAERLGTQGLGGSGALDTQMQAARERAGAAEGTFSGNALMTEAQGRRSELVSLLGQSAGVLNADEQRQLQGKIADLDAFLRQEGITNQDTQFYSGEGLSAAEFQALLNRQAVLDARG